MGPMKPSIHKLSGRYCPHCLSALWQVISSGLEFCPSDPVCDYEVRPEGAQPFNKLQVKACQLNAKRLEVDALHNRLRSALEEVAAMESDPDWVQFVELAAEQLNLPPLTPFQRALPVMLNQNQAEKVEQALKSKQREHGLMLKSREALTPKFVVEQFHDEKGWAEIPGCSFAVKDLAVAELEHREQHHKQRDLQVIKVEMVTETVSREVRSVVKVGLPGMAKPFRTWVKGAGQ